jgi:hypothetical protein
MAVRWLNLLTADLASDPVSARKTGDPLELPYREALVGFAAAWWATHNRAKRNQHIAARAWESVFRISIAS